jgi:hypothetical protein
MGKKKIPQPESQRFGFELGSSWFQIPHSFYHTTVKHALHLC